jgi:hypothetical protein
MIRKFAALIFVALALIATGCSRKELRDEAPKAMMSLQTALAASPERYIAERDKLEIITPESDLQKSWESVVAFCGTIQCEIISSSITTRTVDSVPSGSITLRVAPDDLTKLIANVEKFGKIAQHTTEREDETTAVVDTEAKIKNLTSFRDNLRAMLAKPSATVNDLVEIQKQLTDTQSELDSETAQRKLLANETEKIAVEISLHVERSSENVGGLSQVWNALRESGSTLADSTASLITTIFAIVPWLILILPLIWLLVKGWKALKLRRKQTISSPQPPSAI